MKIYAYNDIKLDEIAQIIQKDVAHTGELKVQKGREPDYLGMKFEHLSEERVVKIIIKEYTKSLLKDAWVKGKEKHPASADLYNIGIDTDDEKELTDDVYLTGVEKDNFYSWFFRALYLAKRKRGDILTAYSNHLSTRVQRPTKRDMEKLQNLLKYLNNTRDKCLFLSAASKSEKHEVDVIVSISTACACHEDMKIHTRVMVYILGEEQYQ